MKRNLLIYMLASILVSFCFIWLTGRAGMAETADVQESGQEDDSKSISDAGKQIEYLVESREKLNQRLRDIENSKNDVLDYIGKLDNELTGLEQDIEDLTQKAEDTDKKYQKLAAELEDIEKEEKIQYDTMKARIKYMYENGNREYIELIFSSESFGELMNRSEYISKITQYDNELLDNYCRLEESVNSKREAAGAKLEELNTLKETREYEKEKVKQLKKDKNKELKAYNLKIGKTREELEKYDEKIKEQEEIIEKLLKEERKKIEEEQKKFLEENGMEDDSGNSFIVDEDELFIWPLNESGVISGYFGNREVPIAGASSYHNGLDIAVPAGTPILAAANGIVVVSRYSSTAGNYVMIYHGGTTYSVYMHSSKLAVKEGDIVYKGQTIAFVGSTGLSTGPHLHFGINIEDTYVDPLTYVTQP